MRGEDPQLGKKMHMAASSLSAQLLEFSSTPNDVSMPIDRKRKMLASIILRAWAQQG